MLDISQVATVVIQTTFGLSLMINYIGNSCGLKFDRGSFQPLALLLVAPPKRGCFIIDFAISSSFPYQHYPFHNN